MNPFKSVFETIRDYTQWQLNTLSPQQLMIVPGILELANQFNLTREMR